MQKPLIRGGRVSTHFRNINITFFSLAFILAVMTIYVTFDVVIQQLSSDYARRYAISSAKVLSTHIEKEVSLMAAAARSNALVDWMENERDEEKRILAFREMSGIIRELYSDNLYFGVHNSGCEYRIDDHLTEDNYLPVAMLDERNPDDAWYFECLSTPNDYIFNVGIDHILDKKRVWLNYKVMKGGVPVGVICAGLDFTHLTAELFTHSSNDNLRGIVIDSDGIVTIDSSLLEDRDFLTHDYETPVSQAISNPVILSSIESYLSDFKANSESRDNLITTVTSVGRHKHLTIVPISLSDWSMVVLYDSSANMNFVLFIPAIVITFILLIAFIFFTSASIRRLIFDPLDLLIDSLAQVRAGNKDHFYGTDRHDEFGTLSKTIEDYFTKANYDVLTGIHNRLYMEDNIVRVMKFLSRPNSSLSVLMIDVDYFKKYNDTYGHEQGDVCLRKIAQSLASGVKRTNDFVARYGGEEFVVVLPFANETGACLTASRLLENVRALKIPHAKNDASEYVTISIGITTAPVDYSLTWEEYLKRADEAVYMSKQNGRNRYTFLPFRANDDNAGTNS
ncbi:MAG: diguanylate cyclase [Oscillospiraceae bacterium]|nr:diguanylate cyclase [Oscillospiraceae bacterium]